MPATLKVSRFRVEEQIQMKSEQFHSTLNGGIFMNIWSDFSLQKSEILLQEI